MKIIRRIATTLALCGTAFFTNMANAGDCGEWVTGGSYVTTEIAIPGSANVPPAYGPPVKTWVATAEFVPRDCGNEENEYTPIIFSDADCVEIGAEAEARCTTKGEKAKALCGALGDLKEGGNTAVALCTYLAIDWTESCIDKAKKITKECIARNRMA